MLCQIEKKGLLGTGFPAAPFLSLGECRECGSRAIIMPGEVVRCRLCPGVVAKLEVNEKKIYGNSRNKESKSGVENSKILPGTILEEVQKSGNREIRLYCLARN